MKAFQLLCDVEEEELQKALEQCFPNRIRMVKNIPLSSTLENGDEISTGNNDSSKENSEESKEESTASSESNNKINNNRNIELMNTLENELKNKESELLDVQNTAKHAFESIKSFQIQQQKIFDEFAILRKKYDDLKSSFTTVLWEECGKHHPLFENIPSLEKSCVESVDEIGKYGVGEVLGEGQFATVCSCWLKTSPNSEEQALKMIKKERIVSFNSLKRLSTEIGTLKLLNKSKYVVHITDCFQTRDMLYIVTEKGGPDLFDFFDEHPDGVPEPWAQQITCQLLKALRSTHGYNICHRDVKPENVLLEFDFDEEKCTDLKLCDFGLCAEYITEATLNDFCGSPGFFAPEMLTQGLYRGDLVDVWSVGCLLLEMVLGHERFCDVWMIAYDYETLQDKVKFSSIIKDTVESLPQALEFSDDLNSFITTLLTLDPTTRVDTTTIWKHPWLKGMDSPTSSTTPSREASATFALPTVVELNIEDGKMDISSKVSSRPGSRPTSGGANRNSSTSPRTLNSSSAPTIGAQASSLSDAGIISNGSNMNGITDVSSPTSALGQALHYANHSNTRTRDGAVNGTDTSPRSNTIDGDDEWDDEVEDRIAGEKMSKMLAGQISDRERKLVETYNAAHTDIQLPPIEPPTPNMGKMRKILKQGNNIAESATRKGTV